MPSEPTPDDAFDIFWLEAQAIASFIEQLDVDSEVAGILVREGFSNIEQIASAPATRLNGIDEFDEEITEALQSRAQIALNGGINHADP